jgi:acyl dehydratase
VTSVQTDRWDEVEAGFDLPPVPLTVPYSRVASVMAVTWDYFPGHHDPDYARRQGQPNIYLNTMFLSGFLDRVVTDWAGPSAFIRSRRLDMIRSVSVDDDLTGTATVTGKHVDDDGHRIVTVEVLAITRNGVASKGPVSFTWDRNPSWTERTTDERGTR